MSAKSYEEIYFQRLISPLHNGIALDQKRSFPKKSALEILEMVNFLNSLGIAQAVVPPVSLPNEVFFHSLGFTGKEKDLLGKVFTTSPELFKACCQTSVNTAQIATLSPAIDTIDNHHHITPANLSRNLAEEMHVELNEKILKAIFKSNVYFTHHKPLNSVDYFTDEGSSQTFRFSHQHRTPGVNLFVYGRHSTVENVLEPRRYRANQTCEAQQAIRRLHQLFPERTVGVQQSPRTIDAGMSQANQCAIANENVFIVHENSFVATATLLQELEKKVRNVCHCEWIPIVLKEKMIGLDQVAKSTLLNSQLVTIRPGEMNLICSEQCKNVPIIQDVLKMILESHDNPIDDVHYISLNESTFNKRGPSSLQLKAVFSHDQKRALHQEVLYTDELHRTLVAWVEKYFRDEISIKDLIDPQLYMEQKEALNALTEILKLNKIYDFQMK